MQCITGRPARPNRGRRASPRPATESRALYSTAVSAGASVPERRPGPSVHVVQPGETLWSVARSLQPEGDVRPLVRALIAANGGPEVDVGDRVVLT